MQSPHCERHQHSRLCQCYPGERPWLNWKVKILPKRTKRCKKSLRRKAVPTAEVAKCDERRQKAFVSTEELDGHVICTYVLWSLLHNHRICNVLSCRSKNRVLPPPEIPAVGASREQPPLPHWDPSTLSPPSEIRRYLVPEGTWPFRFPGRGSESDHWAFKMRQQICSAPPRRAAVGCGTIPCTHLGWEC